LEKRKEKSGDWVWVGTLKKGGKWQIARGEKKSKWLSKGGIGRTERRAGGS